MTVYGRGSSACIALFFAGMVQAAPEASHVRYEHAAVLLEAGGYMPGDEVTNHGGITFSSNGLGAWRAGALTPKARTGRVQDTPIVFDPVPPPPMAFQDIVPLELSAVGVEAGGAPPLAGAVRALSAPASVLLLLPALAFLVATRRRAA